MRLIQYTVKPESADENVALIEAVYTDMAATAPDMRYVTFRLDDGVTFVHVYDGDNAALTARPVFQAFRAGLGDRCATPPSFADASVVGAYGWFA